MPKPQDDAGSQTWVGPSQFQVMRWTWEFRYGERRFIYKILAATSQQALPKQGRTMPELQDYVGSQP